MGKILVLGSVVRGTISFLLGRRWTRWLTIGMVLIAAGPRLLSWTPLPAWIVSRALADVNGTIEVGGVTMGWFARVGLRDVVIRDRNGQTVVTLPRVDSSRTLLDLVLDRTDLGQFRCDQAVIHVVFTPGGSNIEEVFARLMQPDPNKLVNCAPSLPPKVEIVLAKASIDVRDNNTDRQWKLNPLDLALSLGSQLELALHAEIAEGSDRGRIDLDLEMALAAPSNGEVQVKLDALPMAMVMPVLNRFQEGRIEGRLSGSLRLAWKQSEGGLLQTDIAGDLMAQDVKAGSPMLGADTLRLAQVKIPCKIVARGDVWEIAKAEIDGDGVKASLKGVFNSGQGWLEGWRQPGNQVSVDVDVAHLARMLPGTLRLRTDTNLEQGRLRVEAKSVAFAGGVIWEAQVQTTELRGTRGGRHITWPNPIQLDIQARDDGQGFPHLERLICQSGFVSLEGSGSRNQLTLKGNVDIDKLAGSLGQFINLEAVKLTGQAGFHLTVKQEDAQRIGIETKAYMREFHLAGMAGRSWQEKDLTIHLQAVSQRDAGDAWTLTQGDGLIQTGPDRLTVRLLEPLAWRKTTPKGALHFKLEGDFARWQNRVAAFTSSLDAWRLAGTGQIEGRVKIALQFLDVTTFTVQAREIVCQGPGLRIHEPMVEIQAAGRAGLAEAVLDLRDLQVRSPTLVLQAPRMQADFTSSSPTLQGSAVFQGDLGRLRQWTQDAKAPSLAGTLLGSLQMHSSGGRIAIATNLSVKDLVVGDPRQPVYRDALARVSGQGKLDWTQDTFHFDKLHLESQYLACDAAGQLAGLSHTFDLNIQGKLTYDLGKVEPLLRPYLGAGVKAKGKDTRTFRLVGSLVPQVNSTGASFTLASLEGDAGFHWQALKAFGCEAGPAEVQVKLQQGWLKLMPVQTSFNTGRLRLEAGLHLEPDPQFIRLAPGPVIEQARITPEMCASALGYALPALANIAQAEGAVSVSLEKGQLPLADPTRGEVKGTIVLHNAKIFGGGLLRELGGLLKAPASYGIVKEANVPVHMVNGRIHHSNLELIFPDFTLRTSGSVGFDGSLALIAEMPIPPRWFGNQKISAALARQTIKIPLRGTLEQPRLDQKALAAASAQFARDLAAELLRQQIDKSLSDVFRPKIK